MPTTQEILELVYRQVGEAQVERSQKELDRLGQRVERVQKLFDAGTISQERYVAFLDKVAAKARAAQSAIDQAASQMGRSTANINAMAGGIYQLANLMEDAQFGARGLGNNLGMLVATLTRFHPVGMAVGGVLQVLTAVFRDQIDAALDWAGILDKNLSPSAKKAAEDIEGLTAKMATFSKTVGERMVADAKVAQEAAQQVAQGIDDLSTEGEGKLIEAVLGTNGADGRIADLKQKIAEAKTALDGMGPLDVFASNRLRDSISGYHDEILKIRAESTAAAKAEVTELIASAGRGSEEAKRKLVSLAGSIGTPEMLKFAESVWKTTDAAKANAAQIEKVKKIHDQLAETLKEQEKARDELSKADAAAAEERAQRLLREWELEKQVQAERDKAAAGKFNEKAGVQANAFRDMLAPDIQRMLSQAEGNGMDRGDAKAAVIGQATQAMMRAGVKPMEAGSAAVQLVEEQASALQQMVANMDAILGMMVGNHRRGTWDRRQMAAQANMIRRLQLGGNDPWLNNRPGWP